MTLYMSNMERVKQVRKEEKVTKDTLAKALGISVKEYTFIEDNKNEYRNGWGFSPDELELLAKPLGTTASYLTGDLPYISKEEREYRRGIKDRAKLELNAYEASDPYVGFPTDTDILMHTRMAQLNTAANLVRLTESVEQLCQKVCELDYDIDSYNTHEAYTRDAEANYPSK